MRNGITVENNTEDSGESSGADVALPDLIKMTYDITVPYDTCCKFGEDLLRGFLQDLDYDCVIEVSGVHFKAHKCILSARSCYFEAMLSGSWRESETEEIRLEGITPAAMEQTLLYLYGGVTGVNPECSIGELMMVSDMYGLEDLKDVVYFHVKKTYCHFFHKPCSECESRVPEALTYAVMFNMEELRDRCIKWINGHKLKIWHTKSFANLPADVMDLCLKSAMTEMSISNVLETMLDCQKMLRTIPRLKWCEPTLHCITTLMEKAVEYTSKHFRELLGSQKFHEIDKSLAHKMGLLEELLDTVIDSLPVDGACQVFTKLTHQLAVSQEPTEYTLWSDVS
ncbi:hypothetical protein FSP39_004823 [Pinctada imbricata]|uniref:BTB domain-containing protein n=1 Tax=Pinctada imbricata TaxID=66713 RepID=A0AA88XKY7_PINIB|nr:hypothetical protein FSP39_004823 [Pinctada imbricata]